MWFHSVLKLARFLRVGELVGYRFHKDFECTRTDKRILCLLRTFTEHSSRLAASTFEQVCHVCYYWYCGSRALKNWRVWVGFGAFWFVLQGRVGNRQRCSGALCWGLPQVAQWNFQIFNQTQHLQKLFVSICDRLSLLSGSLALSEKTLPKAAEKRPLRAGQFLLWRGWLMFFLKDIFH